MEELQEWESVRACGALKQISFPQRSVTTFHTILYEHGRSQSFFRYGIPLAALIDITNFGVIIQFPPFHCMTLGVFLLCAHQLYQVVSSLKCILYIPRLRSLRSIWIMLSTPPFLTPPLYHALADITHLLYVAYHIYL